LQTIIYGFTIATTTNSTNDDNNKKPTATVSP